jgi:8-amino-7-oxononanoate synthase
VRVVTSDWAAFLSDELDARAGSGDLRSLRTFERDRAYVVTDDARRLLNLSSNDYLGLASHPAVALAAARATARGTGATASRLIVGTDRAYGELEEKLAAFQGSEAALVFGSGYLANAGTISSLVGPGDAVISDELNHASIIDGCRLSRAAIHRYAHRDLDELEAALQRAEQVGARRMLIVTETVFSMNGDVAPLADIVELKERYGAALLVDEAHAVGVFGRHGEGIAHELGVADRVDVHVGTFGKAFGAYGAYVAGTRGWIDYLVNAARTFVFATALPPPVIGAVDAALDVVRDGGELREDLHAKAVRFRARLDACGLDTCGSDSQIVPVLVGESHATLEAARRLETAGILGVAIRPPTVPAGTARIRFSVSVSHTESELDRALEAIELTFGNSA